MSNVLIESQYFPTIGFYSLLSNSKSLIIDQHENYHKGSYRNRCEILSAQGRVTLSVPLKSGKNNQLAIKSVEINNEEPWRVNHLRSIKTCYGKSPYFEFYFPYCESILQQENSNLFELNTMTIQVISKILGLEGKLDYSKHFVRESEERTDLKRDFISPKQKNFLKMKEVFDFLPYDQVFSDERIFEPNLSILDLLFCLGPEAIWYLAKTIR